jgi:DNA invertase Pin-like site-specific DNA recombinase
VEVLRRYSNRPDLLGPVLEVLKRIFEGDKADGPGVKSTGHGGGSAPIRDRLNEADVREIVDRFRSGVPKHKLAAEYGMSLSTMKRLLRKLRLRDIGRR